MLTLTSKTIQRMQHTMRKFDEVTIRIGEIESRLQVIDKAMATQLEMPFFKRKKSLFHFLDLEKKTYSRLLKELKWIIYE